MVSLVKDWFSSTFAHLMQAFAWPIWGFALGGLLLFLVGIGLIVYCYVKSLEASD